MKHKTQLTSSIRLRATASTVCACRELDFQLSTVIVSQPSPSTGWTLQQNTNSVSSVNWSNVTSGIQDDGANLQFTEPSPTGHEFYRLHKP